MAMQGYYQPGKPTPTSSRAQRSKKVGIVSQASYEANEARQRREMTARVLGGQSRARARGARVRAQRANEVGANAGTMGGSRSLAHAFFGKK